MLVPFVVNIFHVSGVKTEFQTDNPKRGRIGYNISPNLTYLKDWNDTFFEMTRTSDILFAPGKLLEHLAEFQIA